MSDPDHVWWSRAVFYQVYVRSFADADGNGVGDLTGIRQRLPYLVDLGVDAVWITPFYRSPMVDFGYDVADPRDIDPLFGDLAAFDDLLAEAHGHGLRVIVDVVPNHTSDQHPWFAAAVAAGPGSPQRSRYVVRDGRGPGGDQPPNNWLSTFGGPAWARLPDGRWFLHLFAAEQPDLNWDNPEVRADFDRTLRFWLDRGVDGFRIDVAHGLAKPDGLPDMTGPLERDIMQRLPKRDIRFDNDRVHEHWRAARRVLDEYGDRVAVGEIWVGDDERLALYVRPDELQLAFNFRLAQAKWRADELRAAVDDSRSAMSRVGAPTTWVLSNHDVPRHVSRYGGGEVGRRRARAAALLQLALPGVAFLYQGDELGLPDADLPDEALRDPVWARSGHRRRGRDACRVPMPWSGERPPYGFAPAGSATWLPMPEGWAPLTVERQAADPDSMLALYRRALRLRRSTPALRTDALAWLDGPADCLSLRRGADFTCVVNLDVEAVPLPAGEVLLASGPLDAGRLPIDTAAWVSSAVR